MNQTQLTAEQLKRKSKKLSWILRHGAKEVGLEMDQAGWVEVQVLLNYLNLDAVHLQEIVQSDPKRRFEVDWQDSPSIRACQGHSNHLFDSLETLENSWEIYPSSPSDSLLIWHGTYGKALAEIAQEGIQAISRTHVHLADDLKSSVGKRANVTFMLGIDVERLRVFNPVYRSPNGVILTRHVPASCIVHLKACSRKAHKNRSDFLPLFPNVMSP